MQVSFGQGMANYTGPKDGRSAPRYGAVLRPIVRALVGGKYRIEIDGKENLPDPKDGPYVFSPTHPGVFDPMVVVGALNRDVRLMLNQYLFQGPVGPLCTWLGAYPVDRENANPVTIQHTNEILQDGNSVIIFPEGVLVGKETGQITPIKKGAAAAALTGGAKAIIPMALQYERAPAMTVKQRVTQALATAGVVAAGYLAFGTGLETAAAVGAGALAGSFLLSSLAAYFAPDNAPADQGPKYLAGVAGFVAGGVLGGVTGGLAPQALLSLTGVAGVGTWCGLEGLASRPVVRIRVGAPIEVAPYAARADQKAAITDLTHELHRALGREKGAMSGVPYDDHAPKLRGKIVETYKGGTSW